MKIETNPYKEFLNKYWKLVFFSDKKSLTKFIMDICESSIEIKDIYSFIIQPFQVELGELWYENKISIAQEHYGTAVSQFVMTLLYKRIFAVPKNGKIFLGTCVKGELHELGIRMVCDYMENSGYRTCYLGANMDNKMVIQRINKKKPNIIAISCTMRFNIPRVSNLIQAIKSSGINTPLIVGGYPFNLDTNLCKEVGADACSQSFEETYLISEELC